MDISQEREKLNTAKERVELGLPPTETATSEFERTLYDTHRQNEMLQSRRETIATDINQPPVVTRTTAEQRPNAYIPDGDLMIPKPYGAHPPYRPSYENSAVYRFYRKPKVEEIQFD